MPEDNTSGNGDSKRSRQLERTVARNEPTYSEKELGLIFKRAAELQEEVGQLRPGSARSASGFTLAEIQQIATDVGIAPQHIEAAATSLRSSVSEQKNFFLGAPTRFRFERSIAGEISDDAVSEIIDAARRETAIQGEVKTPLGAVEWQGGDATGTMFVNITRRGGRTIISVHSARTDAAALFGVLGITGGILGTFVFGALFVAVAGIAAPIAAVGAVAASSGTSWLTMRTAWQRLARRSSDRALALGETLSDLAQRSVNERRIAESDSE